MHLYHWLSLFHIFYSYQTVVYLSEERAKSMNLKAEYLTFITATGKSDVNAVYFNENVWLTQKMMRLRYNVETLIQK